MSTTFASQPYARNRCTNCGTLRHAHRDGTCPALYRPDTLEAARRALVLASQDNDPEAVFVARGNIQRLGGDPDAA
jgi:hypothetical protein